MLQYATPWLMKMTPEKFDRLFGSPSALARAIGENVSTVHCWKHRGTIPPRKALAVSKVTGVPPHEIRPDIYPAPQRKQGRAAASA